MPFVIKPYSYLWIHTPWPHLGRQRTEEKNILLLLFFPSLSLHPTSCLSPSTLQPSTPQPSTPQPSTLQPSTLHSTHSSIFHTCLPWVLREHLYHSSNPYTRAFKPAVPLRPPTSAAPRPTGLSLNRYPQPGSASSPEHPTTSPAISSRPLQPR